jgi:hypothetical protein
MVVVVIDPLQQVAVLQEIMVLLEVQGLVVEYVEDKVDLLNLHI